MMSNVLTIHQKVTSPGSTAPTSRGCGLCFSRAQCGAQPLTRPWTHPSHRQILGQIWRIFWAFGFLLYSWPRGFWRFGSGFKTVFFHDSGYGVMDVMDVMGDSPLKKSVTTG